MIMQQTTTLWQLVFANWKTFLKLEKGTFSLLFNPSPPDKSGTTTKETTVDPNLDPSKQGLTRNTDPDEEPDDSKA